MQKSIAPSYETFLTTDNEIITVSTNIITISNLLQEACRYFTQSIYCIRCNARLREAQSSADQIKLRATRLITSRRNDAGCLTCISCTKLTHILEKYFPFLPFDFRVILYMSILSKSMGERISPGFSPFRNRANTWLDLANVRLNRVNVIGQNTKRDKRGGCKVCLFEDARCPRGHAKRLAY